MSAFQVTGLVPLMSTTFSRPRSTFHNCLVRLCHPSEKQAQVKHVHPPQSQIRFGSNLMGLCLWALLHNRGIELLDLRATSSLLTYLMVPDISPAFRSLGSVSAKS
jgi:hypothetical protein